MTMLRCKDQSQDADNGHETNVNAPHKMGRQDQLTNVRKNPDATVEPPQKKRRQLKIPAPMRNSAAVPLSKAVAVQLKVDGQGHRRTVSDHHGACAEPVDLGHLRTLWRQYRLYEKAETALINIMKAYPVELAPEGLSFKERRRWTRACWKTRSPTFVKRKPPHINTEIWMSLIGILLPFQEVRQILHASREKNRLDLEAQVMRLPIAGFIANTRGLGALNVGGFIAEATDREGRSLERYRSLSALRRRFGLAVFDGAAERRQRGKKLYYSPARRAWLYVIGNCLIKARSPRYYPSYIARKQIEYAKLSALEETNNIPTTWIEHWKTNWKKVMTEKRARRWMEGKFVKDTWNEWRRCCPIRSESTIPIMDCGTPPTTISTI